MVLSSPLSVETLVLVALRKNWPHQFLDINHPSVQSLLSKLSIHSASIYRVPTMCQTLGIQLLNGRANVVCPT